MIDTHSRDPQATLTAVRALSSWGRRQMLLPRHLHLGFFNLRDLARIGGIDPSAMSRRVIIAPATVMGLPYTIVSFEDHISLCCAQASDPLRIAARLEWGGPDHITRKD